MSDIQIVIPKESDIEEMVAWGKSNTELRISENDPFYAPETLKEWVKNPRNDTILIAKDGKKLVGMCLVHHMRDWAYCAVLFVVKEYRGKGIGRKLTDTATMALKKTGVELFGLLVEEQNEDSQKFYEKIGLKKGPVFRWMDKKLS